MTHKSFLEVHGTCPICGPGADFVAGDGWLRDHFFCTRCGSTPRERAQMAAIQMFCPEWRSLTIHESSPVFRGASQLLRQQAPGYSAQGPAGRVFEANEGAGSAPLRAFSPHGLSEGTEEAAAFYADRDGFTFEKFVIPNPFGPYEEPRFTIYLMKTRLKGEVARVQTPGYVRDNIRVSLLAKSYAAFVGASPAPGTARAASARAATRRVKGPLPSACAARLRHDSTRPADSSWAQTEFLGPAVRVNTDLLDAGILGWSEAQAWDELVAFYARERSQ